MAVIYKKLWRILIDQDMKKKDLEQLAGITHYQMYKLANDKDVATEVIGAIRAAFNVRSDEIMDVIPDEKRILSLIANLSIVVY